MHEIATLHSSSRLRNIMQAVNRQMKHGRKKEEIVGPVEADPEYRLIVDANNLAVDIDNEISEYTL